MTATTPRVNLASKAEKVTLKGDGLTLDELIAVARDGAVVELDPSSLDRVDAARRCVEERLKSDEVFYGINTGFGYLAEVRIEKDKLEELQVNLIRSHACAVGDPLPEDIVRAVLVLRIQTMMRGNSGVRRETVELMREFVNRRISPVVPSKGSVGASGDLAPLAHLALALIGEGDVLYKGVHCNVKVAFESEKLVPLIPQPKEGLCLINGTQVMTAIGLLLCRDVEHLMQAADVAAAMTLDATRGTPTPFRKEIQLVRPHPGQQLVAENVLRLLEDDEIRDEHIDCNKVQDPYSIRCTPQVHGAVRMAFAHALQVLLIEANSSTDNPLVFAETNEILSGGNFHGEPVAFVLDYLGLSVAELAGISERRIEKLINPHMSGLPAFLARETGLNSGHMITHVVTAALVSENKILAHPASVDSIPTSADKEDHVSMGMTSANKLRVIVANVSKVLAVEVIAAADGLEFHLPKRGGKGVRAAREWLRGFCPPMITDRSLSGEIEALAGKLLGGELGDVMETKLLGAPLN